MRFSHRRRLCRTVFCACCLLPTILVGVAAFVLHTPSYQAARTAKWQTDLAIGLGLEVRVQGIEWQSSERYVVRGIHLRDPESHVSLARARSASVARSGSGWVVTLGQPEIGFRQLPRLVDLLHEHLLLRRDSNSEPIELISASLVLQQEQQSQTVLDARFALEANREGTQAFIEFRSTGSEEGDQVRLRVVRNRQLDPPATGWELHTGPLGLPCHLAFAWLPQLAQLGDDCTFQGSAWSEQIGPNWEAEVSGAFHQLDLDRLVTSRFPHKLSGEAELTLKRLLVRRNRITQAEGQLHCAAGVVSPSLLDAAQHSLGLDQYPRARDATLVRYRELAVQFSLDTNGLAIAASPREPTDTIAAGALLSDSQGTLLSAPDGVQVDPLALVRLLVPLTELQVPAAQETAALLQILPLPEITPLTPENARRDYSPLRFQPR